MKKRYHYVVRIGGGERVFEDRKRGSVFEKAFPLELEHDVKKFLIQLAEKSIAYKAGIY